jgi:hypothetical protein
VDVNGYLILKNKDGLHKITCGDVFYL